ncbi:MAG TPA: hypothetical protein VGK78_16105 [Nocardioides sp.]|uniref:hypothetical protein n=1 Tax=Nocardioides sp. TaxID=35761 RepID=UPI002F407E7F
MTTMTLTPTRRTTWPVGLALGSMAGTALVIAGVWNALIQQHVSVSAPPHVSQEVPPVRTMEIYYTWYAGTVAQERAATILGLIGVSGLVILVAELRRRLGPRLGRGACTAAQAGGLVWMVGAVAAIGGHRAVGLMATHGNPIETVNAVAFTTDVTSDAFSAASFVLLAVAMPALAAASLGGRGRSFGGQGWAALSVLTGLLSAVVAYGYVAGIDSITSYDLGILAAVLMPCWLVWTGRLLDRSEPSESSI